MQAKKSAFLSAAFVVLAAGSGWAEGEPKGYVCTFETGTAWTFDSGKFAQKPPEPIRLEIADVDLERQTAKLVAEAAGETSLTMKQFREIVQRCLLEIRAHCG